jgi:hypothetical protein
VSEFIVLVLVLAVRRTIEDIWEGDRDLLEPKQASAVQRFLDHPDAAVHWDSVHKFRGRE